MAAQSAPVVGDSITVVPGPQFSTTSWIRWLGTPMFGSRYRELWRTPITLPVLDVEATAGGLTESGRGTGLEAGLIYLTGADGSHWTFYPLDRPEPHSFPPDVVPEAVSEGLIADLTSGRNPAGPLVAAELAKAAEVPNQDAWLVVRTRRIGVAPLRGRRLRPGRLPAPRRPRRPDATPRDRSRTGPS